VVREGLLLFAIQKDMGQEAYLEKYLQFILFVLIAFSLMFIDIYPKKPDYLASIVGMPC
jgi:hypothetical protein